MVLSPETIKRIENIKDTCKAIDNLGELYSEVIIDGKALEKWQALTCQCAEPNQYIIQFDKVKYKKQFEAGLTRVMGLDIVWI